MDTLGIPYVVVNIGAAADALEKTLEENEKLQQICGKTEMAREAKINMPPRIRMATLYAVAQNLPNGGRVVNTCNASEDYVGYSTKYGDAAGDFSPSRSCWSMKSCRSAMLWACRSSWSARRRRTDSAA